MRFDIVSNIFKKPPSTELSTELDDEKKVHTSSDAISNITNEKVDSIPENKSESSEEDIGVQGVSASNQVWSKKSLIATYICIWLLNFVIALTTGTSSTLTPYVTSAFKEHSLTATTSVISSMISGLSILPYAKLLNLWGRPQSFALMVGSMTIGLIMMAGCQNVETYCAAQVFFYVGYTCVHMTTTIFIADTSSLRNRAFVISFESSVWIFTIWMYGPIAESMLNTIGFRWGFGIWAIVVPVTASPLFGLFYYHLVKARKAGFIEKKENNRTFWENVKYYFFEFDVIGLFLIIAGLALFLLAFNLRSKQPLQWKSPLIISFIIIGGLLIIAFAVYEKYFAPVTFIPWELLTDRTVFFTYVMSFTTYLKYYLWDNYFYSYLIVVYNLSVSNATYVLNSYTIASTAWALVVGVFIRYCGRLKWIAFCFGVPIGTLGIGLMINFRQPDVNIGYIVMCQLFIGFGGGTLVICQQITIMAASEHKHIPSLLAMENMFIKIGSAVGSTIAGALWMDEFPKMLARYLPESAHPDLQKIYGSLTVQSSYAYGSPERNGIIEAYSAAQRYMLIAATCLCFVSWSAVLMWRDIDTKNLKKKDKNQIF